MTSKTRDIVLGDRTFPVPVLPLRANRIVYPLCRDLSANPEDDDSFFGRLMALGGTPDAVRDDEWPKLEDIAFHAAAAAAPELTRETFDDMPIRPSQLIDAFFIVRIQTGGWIAPETRTDAAEAPDAGEATPPEAGAG